MPGLEDDVWRQLMRIEKLEKRVSALETVSPPDPAPSESACAPVRRSMKTEEDRRFWAGVGEAARDAPKTGETPPTTTGPHRGPMMSGGGEDPIEWWANGCDGDELGTVDVWDTSQAEIVAVVRAAVSITNDDGVTPAEWKALNVALDALRAKLREAKGDR